jgi:hypothetical protein
MNGSISTLLEELLLLGEAVPGMGTVELLPNYPVILKLLGKK